jgi:hypothetical protein
MTKANNKNSYINGKYVYVVVVNMNMSKVKVKNRYNNGNKTTRLFGNALNWNMTKANGKYV